MATTVEETLYGSDADARVAGAIERARSAQSAWRATDLRDRRRVLERFRRIGVDRRGEIVETILGENGKPRPEGYTEVTITLDLAAYYARIARKVLAPETSTPSNPAVWRKRVTILREPLGVIGVISPWNYPMMLPAGPVFAALVAGNAVILKPSEVTPGTGALLIEMLHQAGAPVDVVQLLQGDGDVGAALVAGGCDKIFFTGSEAVGREIARACGERMIPCALELGGSDPSIVLPDADLQLAARGITWGRFHNAGQTCVAPKRVIAVGDAYNPLVELLAAEARRLSVGLTTAGAEVGGVISEVQRAEIDAMLADAVDQGADIVFTGEHVADSRYFPPTVITGVTDEMRVMREETFGPLLPVTQVANVDEAIDLANRTGYGLSASIWSGDPKRAREVAARLEVGSVAINDVAVTAGIAEAPHGGVKSSGLGRMHGIDGLLECTRAKTIIEERLPRWGQLWWHRYNAEVEKGMDRFVLLGHGRTIAERLRGLFGIRPLFTRR